jgi:hypothetical protein
LTEKQNHAWLSARELNVKKGDAKQFQECVVSSMIAGALPIMLKRGVSAKRVNELLNRLVNMVAVCMSPCSDKEDVLQMELHIWLFLSEYQEI